MLDLTRIAEAAQYEGGVSRRLFLATTAALAALPSLALQAQTPTRKVAFASNPFTLGVASGDPDDASVVLWTKLAPVPDDPDGGMKPEQYEVGWEIAEDEGMKKLVGQGKALAIPQLGHTVHVEAGGLKPDRWYFYRFHVGDAVSPVGRTRTLPPPDSRPDKLRFAFASCQHYEQGLYTAYSQMARDDVDLVFHLGDYIYEGPPREGLVRKHAGPARTRCRTLADYRLRHMQYRLDPLLHGMHAVCPWFVTWDDHEFENNYANDIQEEQRPGVEPEHPVDFLIRRASAYQVYYEMMPLRPRSLPHGPDMQLYRKASFGRLAEFFVLDTRQYRTDQPNGDGVKPLNEAALNPNNTLLGRKQKGWLQAGLITSTATWNVLAQQVMMAMVQFDTALRKGYAMDQWPGYAHERMALVQFLADRKVPNPVVLTGDIHCNWVNNLRVDDRVHDAPVVATEFVGTSISSGGNGSKELPEGAQKTLSANPCVQFFNRERGYVRCTVTPTLWTSDFVVVEDVTQPGGKITTRASFVVEAGKPGAKPA
ncbi:MAG: alkaline phosphatase D family protein [Gemmatales bacterium]|nr:alkaline phosphatase D family protein [Gemmatales bacterium]MDW8386931.1 alkaline phosphatase D family protein [Gemmatales bacterium]